MKNYWITFEDGSTGSCEGQSEYDAKLIAEHFKKKPVKEMSGLPYPSAPRIWAFEHPVYGKTPSFCYQPASCKGKTSCPGRPSCTS